MRDIEGIDEVVRHLEPYQADIAAHFEQENRRFKEMLVHDHDVLGRVLKCHLIVEHYLTRFLETHFGLDGLADAKLSFYQKAQLLPDGGSAAAFVKPGVVRLNKIRNDFGHTLQPVLDRRDLGPIQTVLDISRRGVRFDDPVLALEAFTTVTCTFLIVPPPHFQRIFMEAFSRVRVHGA